MSVNSQRDSAEYLRRNRTDAVDALQRLESRRKADTFEDAQDIRDAALALGWGVLALCEQLRATGDVGGPHRGHYADMEWARDCLLQTEGGPAAALANRAKAAAALTDIIDTFSPAGRAA